MDTSTLVSNLKALTLGTSFDPVLRRFLAYWFEERILASDSFLSRHQILFNAVIAIDELREGTNPIIRQFRGEYLGTSREKIPNLIDISSFGDTQEILQYGVASMLARAMLYDKSEYEQETLMLWLKTMFRSQKNVLELEFVLFARQVYQQNLADLFDEQPKASIAGQIGSTSLQIEEYHGRRMITFSRSTPDEIRSVQFAGDSNDLVGDMFGIGWIQADLPVAIEMIRDVTTHYPHSKVEQRQRFSVASSDSVSESN